MALRTPKVSLLCVGNHDDPREGWSLRRLVRGNATLCKPLWFIMPPQLLHNGSYICCLTRQSESRWRTG